MQAVGGHGPRARPSPAQRAESDERKDAGIIGGECTSEALAMSRVSVFIWTLIFVAAAAAGVYLADQMVLAPSRALQRQLAERDAQIRALKERNQALEAAVRLLRYTERRARLVVLDQAPGPEGHPRTRVRFTELDPQGDPVGEPRELSLDGDEVYVDALVIKFDDTFVMAGDALKGKALLLFRRIFTDRRRPAEARCSTGTARSRRATPRSARRQHSSASSGRASGSWPTIPRRPSGGASARCTARRSRRGSGRTASTPSRSARPAS